MFSFTSKSGRSIGVLSAGAAAALLLTGLGVSSAAASNLLWNPGQSATGGTNGSGTWNGTANWYDSTAGTNPVPWVNGDGAYFGAGTGGTGTYTVTLGSSSGSYSTTNLGVNNSGNAYVLDGGGGTITGTGELLANGNFTLQNIALSAYTTIAVNSNSGTTGSTLNINSGATVAMASSSNLYLSDATSGASGTAGTVNVNGGSLTV